MNVAINSTAITAATELETQTLENMITTATPELLTTYQSSSQQERSNGPISSPADSTASDNQLQSPTATTEATPPPAVIMMPLAQLRPHEQNAKTYGDKETIEDLCKSILGNDTGILDKH